MDSKGFFRLEIPEKLNMARLVVDFWAEHGRGQDVAVYYKDQQITYQDLKDVTDRFANAMHDSAYPKVIRISSEPPTSLNTWFLFSADRKSGPSPSLPAPC